MKNPRGTRPCHLVSNALAPLPVRYGGPAFAYMVMSTYAFWSLVDTMSKEREQS